MKNRLNHQGTMPTFKKAFKEVGIVPISIICFMENRHKGTKYKENHFLIKVLNKIFFVFLGALGALVVKKVLGGGLR